LLYLKPIDESWLALQRAQGVRGYCVASKKKEKNTTEREKK
jgi:hypothetical protein